MRPLRPRPSRFLRLALLLLASLVPFARLAAQEVFTVQPSATVGALGGSAGFSFTVQVPFASAALSVSVFKGGADVTSRFSVTGQSISNVISTGGNYTKGEYTLSLANLASSDAGSYSFRLSVNGSAYGNFSQEAALTIVTSAAPTITRQPQSTTPDLFGDFTLTVQASGVPSPTYQWYRNGVAIAGAKSSIYSPFSADGRDAGAYYVVVSNSAGSVTSATAIVSFNGSGRPTITAQPASTAVVLGQPATFSVSATSAQVNLTYQWLFNGNVIPGASQASYTTAATTNADAGAYSVLVLNNSGGTLSNAATLSFVAPGTTVITAQPASATVTAGQGVSFTVTASGTSLTYQWFKNGTTITGATSATFALVSAQAGDAGSYSVRVTGTLGTAESAAATLVVNPPPAPTVITAQPVAVTVTAGQGASFSVTATGSSLTYQWLKDGIAVAGATSATYTLASAQPADAGSYSVRVTGAGGAVLSASASLTVNPPGPLARLVNLSVRGPATADRPLILGVTVVDGTRNVLLRAAGPALATYGLSGALADPRLAVFDFSSALLAENDNWDAALRDTIASVGAFPFPAGSRDAAIVQSFTGGRTVHGRGTDSGLVLVEAYDIDPGGPAHLSNLSARCSVGIGDRVLIAGFVLTGTGAKRVLIRGVGPTLANYGVTGVLADPQLQVFNGQNVPIASNNDWDASLPATIVSANASAGAFALPAGSKDAALVLTLNPGLYSAQVSGVAGTTGEALVEIYELP